VHDVVETIQAIKVWQALDMLPLGGAQRLDD
jgi:dihydropteroate synthase